MHHITIQLLKAIQDIAGTLPRHCGSTNSEKATPEQASGGQSGKKPKDSMGIPIPLKLSVMSRQQPNTWWFDKECNRWLNDSAANTQRATTGIVPDNPPL
jgi:hypothetical protein